MNVSRAKQELQTDKLTRASVPSSSIYYRKENAEQLSRRALYQSCDLIDMKVRQTSDRIVTMMTS